MDSFWRRLKFYGFGFGIGLVFVVVFFQNRGCSWLPSNRVKNSFLERLIVLPESQKALMLSKNLTEKDIINVLNDGDVNFEKSIKQGKTKVYLLEKEFDGKGVIRFYFTLPRESFISEVMISAPSASKVINTTSGYGDIIHFPKDDNLIYVDTTKLVTCQQNELGLLNPLDIYKLLKKSGRVDFSKTNYNKYPKAEQYLEFTDKKNRVIGTKSIWYKNKINITVFETPFKIECK